MTTNPEFVALELDLLEEEPAIEDESVDVIITSPPYKRKDGLTLELMQALGRTAARVLKPGGRMFVVFGQLRPEGYDVTSKVQLAIIDGSHNKDYEDGSLVSRPLLKAGQTIAWIKSIALPTWRKPLLDEIDRLRKELLNLSAERSSEYVGHMILDTLEEMLKGPGKVLQVGHYQSITMRSPTLNYCWEPILTYFKPPERLFDRLSIGCEFSDKSNITRGTRGKYGDVHCIGDVWFIPYETTGAKKKKATAKLKHAYSYPEELVERCLKVCDLPKDAVVYDPFVGSGTTPKVALEMGYFTYGSDINKEALEIAQQRCSS